MYLSSTVGFVSAFDVQAKLGYEFAGKLGTGVGVRVPGFLVERPGGLRNQI